MRKIRMIFTVIFIVSLLLTVETFAQQMGGYQKNGIQVSGTQYARIYNPVTTETLSGQVISADRFNSSRGMYYGIRLTVKTDKETLSVHVGPEWYVEKQNVKVEPNDKIEVKGSRVTFSGKPVIIAAEIKKGRSVLILRDKNGIPQWSGWRRR